MTSSAPTLVLLAAGVGARFGGPKQLEPLGPSGETLMDYAVFDSLSCGFVRVVVVTREVWLPRVEEHAVRWRRAGAEVAVAVQRLEDVPAGVPAPTGRTAPWGTAPAVLAARNYVGGPLLAANADDFYGREAYAALGRHIAERPGEAALAGYRLRDTLSPHGGVARAVCSVSADGLLAGIREVDGIGGPAPAAPLTGEETVSMNLWALTADVMPKIESLFAGFLASRPAAAAEFRLPDAIGSLVSAGLRVRVIRPEARWLGVTYPADAGWVRAELAALVANGRYPSPLFAG